MSSDTEPPDRNKPPDGNWYYEEDDVAEDPMETEQEQDQLIRFESAICENVASNVSTGFSLNNTPIDATDKYRVNILDESTNFKSNNNGFVSNEPNKNTVAENTPVLDSVGNNTDKNIDKSDGKNMNKKSAELIVNNYVPEYVHLYRAPFIAYIQHADKNIGRLHEMSIGHMLHKDLGLKTSIKSISRSGANRIKIEMNTIQDVIDLVNKPALKSRGYHCFVPKYLTERRGVIRYVDTCFSDSYILENIECDGLIKEVKRIVREVTEGGQTKRLPTQTVILTFHGNKLPEYCILNSCRRLITSYVYKPVLCFKCLHFGHVKAQCRSSVAKCRKCGDTHEGECDASAHKCLHCKSKTHDALSKECPAFKKELLIKQKMADNNIPYREAKATIDNPNSFANVSTFNRFSLFENCEDFPALQSRPRNLEKLKIQSNVASRATNRPIVAKKRPRVASPPPVVTSAVREFNVSSLPSRPIISEPNPYRPPSQSQIVEMIEKIVKFVGNMFKSDKVITFDESEIKGKLMCIVGQGLAGVNPARS